MVAPAEGVKISETAKKEDGTVAAANGKNLGRRLSFKVGQIRDTLFARAKKVVEEAGNQKKPAAAKSANTEVVTEKVTEAPEEPVAPAVAEITDDAADKPEQKSEQTPVVAAAA